MGICTMPGAALDLTYDDEGNTWDFSIASQRRKAEGLLEQQRPMLLIGSPMCTPFSNIQNFNKARRDPGVVKKEIDNASIHLAWCCKLHRQQVRKRAHLLHEHPNAATSWTERCIMEVLVLDEVGRVIADQC